jgi:hypothetical protein
MDQILQIHTALLQVFSEIEWILSENIIVREPKYLWLIPILVVIVAFLLLWGKRRRVKDRSRRWVSAHISTARLLSRRVKILRSTTYLILPVLFSIAATEPEMKTTTYTPVWGSVRVCYLLDISQSMVDNTDLLPTREGFERDRLGAAIEVSEDSATALIKEGGGYEFCLIPFTAAASHEYMPPTSDTGEFFSRLRPLRPELYSSHPGTSLWAAEVAYFEMLHKYRPTTSSFVDIVVLISDGGAEGDELQDATRKTRILRQAEYMRSYFARHGWSVVFFTVGIGSEDIELEESGDQMSAPLDAGILKDIAEVFSGAYVHFKDREQMVSAIVDIALERRQLSHMEPVDDYLPLAPFILSVALFLLLYVFGLFRPLVYLLSRFRRRKDATAHWGSE